MAIQKTLTNPTTFTQASYWKLSEYSHFIESKQIRLVINGYVSKEVYDQNGIKSASETRVYLLDTEKKIIQNEIMRTEQVEAVYEERDGEQVLVTPAYEQTIGTGEYEQVWINEKDYVNADALIAQVLPFIYNGLVAKGDFQWGEVVE